MSDPHPRYVLLEQKKPNDDGQGRTVYTILDAWYCYRTAWRAIAGGEFGSWLTRPAQMRKAARHELASLNAAHDAWLADA